MSPPAGPTQVRLTATADRGMINRIAERSLLPSKCRLTEVWASAVDLFIGSEDVARRLDHSPTCFGGRCQSFAAHLADFSGCFGCGDARGNRDSITQQLACYNSGCFSNVAGELADCLGFGAQSYRVQSRTVVRGNDRNWSMRGKAAT